MSTRRERVQPTPSRLTGARARRGRPGRVLTTTLLAVVVGVAAGPARARPLESTSTHAGAGPARGDGDGVVPPVVPPSAVGAYAWPLDTPVLAAPWVAPTSPYGPGHRGVDLEAAPGTRVGAMGAGTVGFAGVVAGRAWVSVDHPHAVRTTVGPMAMMAVARGDVVVTGSVLGTAAATAHADAVSPRTGRLHVSARVDGAYVDPSALVGAWVASLVPD